MRASSDVVVAVSGPAQNDDVVGFGMRTSSFVAGAQGGHVPLTCPTFAVLFFWFTV